MKQRTWWLLGGCAFLLFSLGQAYYQLDEAACFTPFVTLPRPAGDSFTLLLVGDAGNPGPVPEQLAQAAIQTCQAEGCNAMVLLGDNLYPRGIQTPQDPEFQKIVLDRWSPLGLPIYGVLGNHDVKASGLAQVQLHGQGNWNLPSGNYEFHWGPARLLFLNSNCQGWEFLQPPPTAPAQPWTLLFLHHNLYGTGSHGDAPAFWRWIFEATWGQEADLVVSGHEHLLEHLTKQGSNPQYLISGAGGGEVSATAQASQALSRFRHAGPGFILLQVTPRQLKARFFDARPQLLTEVVIQQ